MIVDNPLAKELIEPRMLSNISDGLNFSIAFANPSPISLHGILFKNVVMRSGISDNCSVNFSPNSPQSNVVTTPYKKSPKLSAISLNLSLIASKFIKAKPSFKPSAKTFPTPSH